MASILTYKLTDVNNMEIYDTSSLQALLVGGTGIDPAQMKQVENLFPHAEVIFGYGMTECGMLITYSRKADRTSPSINASTCGKIVNGTRLKIADPETEEILGANQKGEVRIKHDYMMQGYLNMDNALDNDGFFKTGDIGFYDEHECLYICGRLKESFKYRSWHIVPFVIESILMEHPVVKEVAVFGIPKGEEGEIPAACVTLHDNSKTDENELIKFVDERVSEYEKLRGGLKILKDFPRTPTGKVIKNELKNIYINMI